MKTLHAFTQFVVLLSLPLLLGGCVEKKEVVEAVKLDYKITNESVIITGPGNYHRWGTSELVIPDEIEGKPVTSIGEVAFWDEDSRSKIESITVGKNISTIGFQAFSHCDNLKEATFLGDFPEYCNDLTFPVFHNVVIYRKADAKGWGETYEDWHPVKVIRNNQ